MLNNWKSQVRIERDKIWEDGIQFITFTSMFYISIQFLLFHFVFNKRQSVYKTQRSYVIKQILTYVENFQIFNSPL